MAGEIRLTNLNKAILEKYEDYKSAANAMGYADQSPITRLLRQDPGKVRSDTLKRIKSAFPDYDISWLLNKKDSPILAVGDQINKPDGITPVPYEDYMMVEYEDLATAAGHLGVDEATLNLLPDTKKRLVPKEFERGKYLVVKVDGHSMDNGTSISIPDGTEILIKELELNNGERLPIRNNLFVIVSKDGVVLKQITEHNIDEGYIKCHSYNPKFKDYIIPLSDIIQVFVYRKIVSSRPPIPDIEK